MFERRNRRGELGRGKEILVPVCNTPESSRVVDFVVNNFPYARIRFAHVVEVARKHKLDESLSEDSIGEELLVQKETMAKKAKVSVAEGDLIHARDAGEAIIEEAEELKEDIIVMGIKQPNGELLSPTVKKVLSSSQKMVILVRPAK